MIPELLKGDKSVGGAKQVIKAVRRGMATEVFVACDADSRVTEPVEAACRKAGILINKSCTMRDIGKACGIPIGASAAAKLNA